MPSWKPHNPGTSVAAKGGGAEQVGQAPERTHVVASGAAGVRDTAT